MDELKRLTGEEGAADEERALDEERTVEDARVLVRRVDERLVEDTRVLDRRVEERIVEEARVLVRRVEARDEDIPEPEHVPKAGLQPVPQYAKVLPHHPYCEQHEPKIDPMQVEPDVPPQVPSEDILLEPEEQEPKPG